MKTSPVFFIAVCIITALQTFDSYAQRFRTTRGLRPAINLIQVPDSAFNDGVFLIKFKSKAEIKLKNGHSIWTKNNALVGLDPVDALGKKLGVKSMTPLLTDNAVANEKQAVKNSLKARHEAWGFHLWYRVSFAAGNDVKKVVKDYLALTDWVEIAEPEYKVKSHGESSSPGFVSTDTMFSKQWHYHNTGQENGTTDADIDLPEAWEIETGKPNVIVAIIDTGLDTNHVDLKPNLWIGPNGERFGRNFSDNTSQIEPWPHGTHVAGTVGAVNNNVAYGGGVAGGDGSAGSGVRLMICQGGTNNNLSTMALVNSFIWSADNGAAIAQNSWGVTVPEFYNTVELDAIDYFIENGGGNVLESGLVIFSAGNSNRELKYYPGSYERVIGVAATNNRDRKAYYSNFGETRDISAPGGELREIAGGPVINGGRGGVLSTYPMNAGGYLFNNGTSMAAPHVSGVAALIASKAQGRLSADDIRSVLLTQVDNHYPANDPSYSGKLGSGRLNAHKALLKTAALLAEPQVDSAFAFKADNPIAERLV